MPRKKTQKKGRAKGKKLDSPVILFNRWNLMFYTTIKGKTEKGNDKVIGRDYRHHSEVYNQKHDKYRKAHDALITKFLKSLKKATYKEDIIRDVPYFFVIEEVENAEAQVDKFEAGDKTTDNITNKEATLERLDNYFATAILELTDVHNRADLAAKATTKWLTLKVADKPVGKDKSQSEKIKEQLNLFKW